MIGSRILFWLFYTLYFLRGLNKMSPSVPPTGNQEELKQVFV